MPWGSGWGSPFGGGGVVPLSSPRSNVGDAAPVAFDFTTDPDGPLPGMWAFYALADDGSGNKTVSAEATPSSYFRVANGLGFWDYTSSPASPLSGEAFTEHGMIAAPVGILQGQNADISVAFVAPPLLWDPRADEFVFEVNLGYRVSGVALNWFGARARAHFVGGAWSPGALLEAIQYVNGAPVVLDTPAMPLSNEPTDFWDSYKFGSLEVVFRDNQLTSVLNGVVVSSITIPATGGDATPLVWVKVFNRYGSLVVSAPSIAGLELQTLRDLDKLGGIFPIPGDSELDTPLAAITMKLPLADLMNKGYVSRIGGRVWKVLQDVDVTVYGSPVGLRTGDIIKATEPYHNQELVPFVFDLAYDRGLRERT